MRLIADPFELRSVLDNERRQGESVGFVPTMGALHQGHLSLCRVSRADNSRTVVSIFVNPLQFGPREDLSRYPRNLEADRQMLEAAGVDYLFAPEPDVMYPPGFQTRVEVVEVSTPLEGAHRPGHFRGVATVVLKLFNMVGPCRAYFGEKDFQQLQVLRRMALDLNVPVEIIPCPTVREPDGLAMSSRNRYLSPAERQAAPAIYAALREAQVRARDGEDDASALIRLVESRLVSEPLLQTEYVAVADADTMQSLDRIDRSAVMAVAVRLASARLIDNIRLR